MAHLEIPKTYKLFIGGQFPRTESGRSFSIQNAEGGVLANLCRASRKDFRNAVAAARKAQAGWADRTAYNRSQILYRLAEILDGRSSQFIEELVALGHSEASAQNEVQAAVDRLVYYAGWCDKYVQIAGTVNPVSTSHFNFSVPEPMGLVGIVCPDKPGLLGLVSQVAPVIAGGNTCVVLASETQPLSAVTFAEVAATSDVPAGVLNILTGYRDELLEHFATHMDVNALTASGLVAEDIKTLQEGSALNLKRVYTYESVDAGVDASAQGPHFILDCQEIKTTWHPVEAIRPKSGGY